MIASERKVKVGCSPRKVSDLDESAIRFSFDWKHDFASFGLTRFR